MLLRLKAHIKRAASDEAKVPATRSESLTDTWVPVETDEQKALRKEQQKNRKQDYDRERRKEKREKGECYNCLKPAVPGKGGHCVEHYEKQLKYQETTREQKRNK